MDCLRILFWKGRIFMNTKEDIMKNKISDEQAKKVAGGVAFKVQCSCCGKDISYATHRWGKEDHGSWTGCKGYLCNECVDSFHNGEITDDDKKTMFEQLDSRSL